MLFSFSGSVTDSGGRTVFVYPRTQIVRWTLDWLTAVEVAPGVHRGSGRANRPVPRAWQAVDVCGAGGSECAAGIAVAAEHPVTTVTTTPPATARSIRFSRICARVTAVPA